MTHQAKIDKKNDIFGYFWKIQLYQLEFGVVWILLRCFGGRGLAGRHLSDSVLLSACWFSSFGTFYPFGSRRSWNSTPPQLRFSHWLYNSQASRVLHKEAWYLIPKLDCMEFLTQAHDMLLDRNQDGLFAFRPTAVGISRWISVESREPNRAKKSNGLEAPLKGHVVQVLDARGCFFLLRSLLVWHTPRKWTSTVTDATNFLALCLGVWLVALWTWMALMDGNQWQFSDVTWRKHWGIRLIGCAGGDPGSNSKEWGQNKEER